MPLGPGLTCPTSEAAFRLRTRESQAYTPHKYMDHICVADPDVQKPSMSSHATRHRQTVSHPGTAASSLLSETMSTTTAQPMQHTSAPMVAPPYHRALQHMSTRWNPCLLRLDEGAMLLRSCWQLLAERFKTIVLVLILHWAILSAMGMPPVPAVLSPSSSTRPSGRNLALMGDY